MWLALLFVRPHLVFVPAALFLITKRYKVLQGLLSGVVGLAGVGLLVGGAGGVLQYAKTLFFVGRVGDAFAIHPGFEPTVKSLLHALYGTNEVTTGILITRFACFILFWGYAFATVQMIVLLALLPLSAVTACILLVCTLYLLYFEYRHESAHRERYAEIA